MYNDISNRIKKVVAHFCDGNNRKFASIVETGEANIRNYIAGRQPRFEVISSIASKFEVNCEWLLTGKGEMLASGEEKTLKGVGECENCEILKKEISMLQQLLESKNETIRAYQTANKEEPNKGRNSA
ncbi:hypothetical protein [Labilibaculum euxinus]